MLVAIALAFVGFAARADSSATPASAAKAASAPTSGTVASTRERILSNGLKVVVREDRRSPVVVQFLWYRAGAMDEPAGASGVAHLLEHLMFKGTQRFPDGEFSRRVANAGGRENAFTSYDYTAYFQQAPRAELAALMEMEADRMRNLRLAQSSFESERAVVMEERRLRIEDQPMGRLYEQLMASAFVASPYGRPVIGWMSDIATMTLEDVRTWYDSWYVPNNAVLVIAGDVDAQQVFELAERFYGGIPSAELPKRPATAEPPQHGVRRAEILAPADSPALVLAFKVPGLEEVDGPITPYALDLLAAVLDDGDTGRLTRRLVRGEQRLATNAGASYSLLSRGPATFTLSARPAPGVGVEQLEEALLAQIAAIAKEGVEPHELQRIKAQYVASRVYQRDSLFSQVMEIGGLEMRGFSHTDIDRVLARAQAVEAADVQAVAARFFEPRVMTAVTLVPLPLPLSQERERAPEMRAPITPGQPDPTAPIRH